MKGEGDDRGKEGDNCSIYIYTGITLLIVSAQSKYIPVHASFVGLLNIISSCGVHIKKKWMFYTLISVSLISLVFGSTALAAMILTFNHDLISVLVLTGFVAYILLSITLLAYAIVERNKFT
ncbi:MAG: hypothetical protein QXE14_04330 [Candidatus Bathyarchaeia archaeon]